MRTIWLYTSTRAEFGLIMLLLNGLKDYENVATRLIVSGGHLDESQGKTICEISSYGIPVAHSIDTSKFRESADKISKGMRDINEILKNEKPDILVVLGDRYELYSIVLPAFLRGIPICHIAGGEITRGSLDDSIRHSISKLSNVHLVATNECKKRLIQLGERSRSIHVVGGIGASDIKKLKLKEKSDIESSFGIKFSERNFLVTYHPDTTLVDPVSEFKQLLSALVSFEDTTIIFTYANLDFGGLEINRLIEKFCKKKPRYHAVKSLGRINYLSVAALSDCVIGNSSSGVTEIPSLDIPTVNIGQRQKGRSLADSVICCEPESSSIKDAIFQASSKHDLTKGRKITNPYFREDTIAQMCAILYEFSLSPLAYKEFIDL